MGGVCATTVAGLPQQGFQGFAHNRRNRRKNYRNNRRTNDFNGLQTTAANRRRLTHG
jgi:hypothetical protein